MVHIFIGKFSCEKIESQYKAIRELLFKAEKYRYEISVIKKDFAYISIKQKKIKEGNIISWMKACEINYDR